ncbi:aminotransferase class V-fold PLP-dependent enzyme [Fortiea sp. LEGE XX443]|uniref:aminotransferase class V-fold PLP-dependent enzyme n=1 Tax=Fortiea sp. LEGE XX443 TaxID=1828611 RepID=UPI00187E5722|nr:aminotransferase class V-fold PLP-dependent enzyme [Fortiea sp. LEGE XX443]MBE9006908.1 aminotransferase class V-fold PLP-dependent enzyme [Fortiea sp. LEGE XX443]
MTSISATQTELHHYREEFPALMNKIYFNYGGQGPLPKKAINAIIEAETHIQHLGPFGNEVGRWIGSHTQIIKQAIASELNAPPETITLTENVTIGCNIPLWGIDWHSGDHLLLSDCEHQGVIAAAKEIGRRFHVEVTTCPLMATLNEGDPVAVVSENLRPNTRLVILSHVLWNTGQVLPLDKIIEVCRKNNSLILVDAAQSVGLLPLNLSELGVDFYAFTGHKWWCGPAGVGGLYVRPEALEKIAPTFVGWRSVIKDSQGQPIDWCPDGRRYEVGTSAYSFYAGLVEAIALHQQWGTAEERYQQICHNSEYLWRKLSALPQIKCLCTSPPESGLVSFQFTQHHPQASVKLVQFLESQRIFTRTIANPDCIRATVHYFTLESEIDLLVEQIERFEN